MPGARRFYTALCASLALLLAGLLTYSQSMAFAWDEGFHVLAAQLILRGRVPYRDFVFSQTPLNTYWNAFWMRVFGDTWHTPHAVAAVCVAGAVWATADYLWRRFPDAAWRAALALLSVALVGMNVLVVTFGTLAQAYGLCLLLLVAAFRASVAATARESGSAAQAIFALLAGLASGAAANASLLTAPAFPVLLVWMLVYCVPGRRVQRAAAFLAGAATACIPLAILFALSPRNAVFNVLEYNLRYRQVRWDGAGEHNLEVMLSWIDSSHALALAALALAGVFFVRFRSGWQRRERSEFYLAAALALALGVHISTATPTFERYYLFTVPFLAVAGAAGVYWLWQQLAGTLDRAWMPVAALALLLSLGLGKSLWEQRDDFFWSDIEETARQVDKVTPPGAALLADEAIYFATRRLPPEGMELADSHKLESFSPQRNAQLHVVGYAEVDRRIRTGWYRTVEMCNEEKHIEDLKLSVLYASHEALDSGCSVFWDWRGPEAAAGAASQ